MLHCCIKVNSKGARASYLLLPSPSASDADDKARGMRESAAAAAAAGDRPFIRLRKSTPGTLNAATGAEAWPCSTMTEHADNTTPLTTPMLPLVPGSLGLSLTAQQGDAAQKRKILTVER